MSLELEAQVTPTIRLLSRMITDLSRPSILSLTIESFKGHKEKLQEIKDTQIEIIKQLADLDVDPVLFDTLLSKELDRSLKQTYGMVFIMLTVLFTILSYAMIVLNSILKWGIPEQAITALIVEVPIQFIGLLYIIAKNLFPSVK